MANFNRHKVKVGSKLKIGKIVCGVDVEGLPYWKFYVPFTMQVNGNSIIFKHLWCKVYGQPLDIGDWVEITEIFGFQSNCQKDTISGGMQTFDDLIVEIRKVEKKNG